MLESSGDVNLTLEYPDAEVVFGIVCAVGTDYRPVVDSLTNLLRRARYSPQEFHISAYFPEIASKFDFKPESPIDNEYSRIDAGMKTGNLIRERAEDPGFLALDVASRIFSSRPSSDTDDPEGLPRAAHIIISLKRPEEVETLRKIYGPGFFLIGIFASEEERHDYLENEKGVDPAESLKLIDRDQKEEDEFFGQRTRDTFELADVFVALKDEEYKHSLRRFIQLVFGYPYATPTRDEYAMFLAYSASARSGALARQVGVAILSAHGDLLALGCNDVPAPGGGLYWEDAENDYRESKNGEDSNDKQKEEIVESALKQFKRIVPEEFHKAAVSSALKASVAAAIKDITEFGRCVHAEMDAITTCARVGTSIAGGTLFTTTFPCHNCTRHIIASGISRVVYIEPYPKSQAGSLHGDAICVGPCGKGECGKIPFEAFVGIGPRRFFDLFSLRLSAGYRVERKVQGQVIKWRLETHAKARVPMAATSYIQREQYISKAIISTYKAFREKVIQSGGSETRGEDGRSLLGTDGADGGAGRKVATMESRREISTSERTGTFDDESEGLFGK
jgi:deoxycytidylate deaminase